MGKDLTMLIIFGVVLLGMGIFFLVDKSKKSKANNKTTAKVTEDKPAMSGVKKPEKAVEQKDMSGFIKFDKIANDMIYQNNGQRYTMVIQCKGINYNLMSEIEQMAVEEGFIMFLNTLKFPIQLYVQTRSVDLSGNVRQYKERVKQFVDKQNEVSAKYNEVEEDVDSTQEEIDFMKKEKVKYTNIAEYVSDITRYVERMALNKYMLQRNFYVVCSYNKSELITTDEFSKEEYEDLCYRELYTRAQGIIGSLVSCSINCKILNSNELAQLLYVSFNKDDANIINIKDALDSGIFRLYTSSEDVLKKKQAMLDEELERQSKIRVEEAVKKAIENGLIVTQAESEEAVKKEIDRRALKIIDKSTVDEGTKQVLKNTIKEDRKERLKAVQEEKEKQLAEMKSSINLNEDDLSDASIGQGEAKEETILDAGIITEDKNEGGETNEEKQ